MLNFISADDFKKMAERKDELFELWLSKSGITEDELLKYRKCTHYKITDSPHLLGEPISIVVTAKFNGTDHVIGCPICASEGMDNFDEECFYYEAALLLIKIADVLDEENKKHMDSYVNDYFTHRTEKFLQENHKVKDDNLRRNIGG